MITETRELEPVTSITPYLYSEEYKYCQDCGSELITDTVSVHNGFNPTTGAPLESTKFIHCPNYEGGNLTHYAWREVIRFEKEPEYPTFQVQDWNFTPTPYDRLPPPIISGPDTTGI